MDAKLLKKNLLKKALFYGIILFAAAGFYTGLKMTFDSFEESKNNLKRDVSNLRDKLDSFNRQTLEFADALKDWESFSPGNKLLQGLRISEAKDELDRMANEYKLSGMQISFSKPEINPAYTSDTVEVMSSFVNITFFALTDDHVFDFLGALMNEYPGHIQINNLNLTLTKDISKEVIGRVALGEAPALVSVKVDFSWYDFRYKGPIGEQNNQENEQNNGEGGEV